VIDPRHTQSVGLFQSPGSRANRLVGVYPFRTRRPGPQIFTLKGDLAESVGEAVPITACGRQDPPGM